MRRTLITILILSCSILFSIKIPYSDSILTSDKNHISKFVRITPADSLEIPLQTDVWIWHDKENLKLYFKAEINDKFVKGKIGKRDEWVECDFIRAQVITDINNYYAYMYCAFPLGNKYDGIRKSDLTIDYDWNSDYYYINDISDTHWTCIMTIPLKDLRFYGSPPYDWKIILTRYFKEEDDYYSIPFGTIDMGKDYFRTAYNISIDDEIEQNKNFRVTSYFIGKYDILEETESFDYDNIGVDFSYNLTTSTKMKLSINPDFTDTPMDVVEDNFNIRYTPSYSENRYFFIEDLDVFGVDDQLFYSRYIIQPQYAVKLTGNSENFSYGFLSARDKKVTDSGEVLNEDDLFNVLAFKPKWRNLSIQMTLLNRMNKNYHNEVLVINPVWEFIHNHSFWIETDLSLLNQNKTYTGYIFSAGYNGKRGFFDWSTSVEKCSKDYYADMGLVYRTDYLTTSGSIDYKKEVNNGVFNSLGSNIWFNRENDSNNNLFQQNGGFGFWSSFEQKFNLSGNINIGQEDHNNKIHNWSSININLSSWKYNLINYRISYGASKTLVYALDDLYNQNYYNIDFWGDLSTKLSYSIILQHTIYQNLPDDCGLDDNYLIGNLDLTIHFSNSLSLTNGFRFDNYENSYSTKHLGFFSNLQFEFKKNSNFYLGYKTASNEVGNEYLTAYEQAFMKISYTF